MKNNILKLILFIPFIIYCSGNKNITGDEFPFIGVGDWVFSETLYPTKSENIRIENILVVKICYYWVKLMNIVQIF